MPKLKALLGLLLCAAAIGGASASRRDSKQRASLAAAGAGAFLANRTEPVTRVPAGLALLAADGDGHGHGHGDDSHAEESHGHGHGHGGHAEEDHGHGHEQGGHAEEAHAHKSDGHGHSEEHAHDHGHGHGTSSEGAHSVAVGLIATVVIVPIVMFMAMSDWLIATLTFKMLDTFVSIFLAVLWFNTFAQFLDTFDIKQAFPLAAEFFALLQCLVLYGIALAIAYLWRDERLTMTTFCSVGAHFIAFAGILASTQSQRTASELPPKQWEPAASFGFCIFVFTFIAGVSALTWFMWRRDVKHEALNHAVEHLELDIVGLVVSFAVTQAVRHAIMGKFPAAGHLLLQEAGHGPEHADWQVWFMFGWATALTIVAGASLPKLSALAQHGPWAERGVHVTKVILIMLVAWGYLLWGEWEFYERLFKGDVMFGHMLFACIATLVCLSILYLMAVLQGRLRSPQARETQTITITGISLVAAWSWEHCFNIAIDVIGQEYEVGYKGLVPKLVLSIAIPLVLLPTYVTHIRKRVMDIEKHEHEQGHSTASDGDVTAHHVEQAPQAPVAEPVRNVETVLPPPPVDTTS